MSNAKQEAAIVVALNDQTDAPAVRTQSSMAATLDAPSGATQAGSLQDGGMLVLTALAAVVVLALRRRQR